MPDDKQPKPNPLDGSDYPLSEALEKEKRKSEIPVHGRHMWLRIGAFVVVLGIAVTFISLGVAGVFNSSSGMQEIKVTSDKEEGVRHGKGFHLYYLIEGSGFSTNAQISEVRAHYTEVMRQTYRLYDEYNVYPEAISLRYLSDNRDRDIEIDPRLYATLREIYENEAVRPYLFLSPLQSLWETIAASPTPYLYDPERNQGNKEAIASYLPILHDADSFSLTFKEGNLIRFHAPESYATWATDYEYSGPLLSLGPLKDAMRMRQVGQRFAEKGLKAGILFSDNGSILSFGGLKNIATNVYGFNKSNALVVGMKEISGTLSSIDFHLTPIGAASDGVAYITDSVSVPGTKLLRNLILDPETGMPIPSLAWCHFDGETTDIAALKIKGLTMLRESLTQDIAALAQKASVKPTYSLPSESLILHVPASATTGITLVKEYQTTIQTY